ncbi:hypothetical protein [Streptomyces niveiscabiei]|uniref:hypothetical protein n=1 Tax=Streptomyces niveiscabiei TaxID=164115 RepID=UPI00389A5B06
MFGNPVASFRNTRFELAVVQIPAERDSHVVRGNCVAPGILGDGIAGRPISTGDLDEAALAAARRDIPLRALGVAGGYSV